MPSWIFGLEFALLAREASACLCTAAIIKPGSRQFDAQAMLMLESAVLGYAGAYVIFCDKGV